MLVLSRDEVETLLDLDRLMEAVASAMVDLSTGRASMPPRIAASRRDRNAILAAMPAHVPGSGALTAKLVSVFPHNAGGALPTHQAVIVAFDPENGSPTAVMDGTAITAARTAAGSALATRLLARDDARVMAVLGTGVQARAHLRALPRVRTLEEIRIAGRDPEKARALVTEIAGIIDCALHPAGSWAAACDGADIVCGTTHADEPVIRRQWIAPGTHVNSVGFSPGREVDSDTVRDALLVVESRGTVLSPYPVGANDIVWPVRDGIIDPSHIHAEIGEIVAGTRSARSSPDQITLYKSVGVAVQDAAAATLVLRAARQRGLGRELDL
jgi:alanine dehydrogenase